PCPIDSGIQWRRAIVPDAEIDCRPSPEFPLPALDQKIRMRKLNRDPLCPRRGQQFLFMAKRRPQDAINKRTLPLRCQFNRFINSRVFRYRKQEYLIDTKP